MAEIPNIVRERLKAARAGDHPDANLLAAFAERALPDRERIPVLEHLARCNDCRDVLALATPPLSVATVSGTKDTAPLQKVAWLGWPALRWGALAACVVIVGTAVFVRQDLRRSATVAYTKSDAVPPTRQPEAEPPLASTDAVKTKTLYLHDGNPEPKEETKAERDREKVAPTLKPSVPARAALASTPSDTSGRSNGLISREFPGAMVKQGFALNSAPTGTVGGPLGTTPVPAPRQTLRKDDALTPPDLPLQGRNVVNLPQAPPPPKLSQSTEVGGANETVEVQSAAVQAETATMQYAQKKEAPGKAKGASSDASLVTLPATSNYDDKMITAAAEARANKLEARLARGAFASPSRWTISGDGQLQHSVDSGKTWQPVAVAENAAFRALSANGPDVWVGGPAGLLFHSSDAGAHWVQIKPAADGTMLTADIATIEFADRQHGKLTTATGEIWVTADAGKTWQKQS